MGMRFAAKVDANQAAIVDGLRGCGASVETKLSRVGGGVPDLLVGFGGMNFAIEVKNPEAKGKLNKRQREWFDNWRGQKAVVETLSQALRVIGAI